MAYRNTLQADALKLVAQKLQSSLAVEGELPEDGLAAYGDDGDDLLLALARRIDAGAVESVFEQARQVAAEAWRGEYNTQRPHSSLGWLSPAAYAERWREQQPAGLS